MVEYDISYGHNVELKNDNWHPTDTKELFEYNMKHQREQMELLGWDKKQFDFVEKI